MIYLCFLLFLPILGLSFVLFQGSPLSLLFVPTMIPTTTMVIILLTHHHLHCARNRQASLHPLPLLLLTTFYSMGIIITGFWLRKLRCRGYVTCPVWFLGYLRHYRHCGCVCGCACMHAPPSESLFLISGLLFLHIIY